MKRRDDNWFEQIPIDLPSSQNPLPPWVKQYAGVIVIALAVLVVVVAFRPWVTVQQESVGVVMRLGKFNRIVSPGFHFRLPPPIEVVHTPRVREVKRVEIGFRSGLTGRSVQNIAEESHMLTGDENIVVSNLIVQYRISDPLDYLFNMKDVESTLKSIAEAAQRQVIGDYAIDATLTWGRSEIETLIQATIQEICDEFKMGVFIIDALLQETTAPDPVVPAFSDVISAREDQARFVNVADGYRNSEIPRAEGEVRKILEEAEAYREVRVNQARGDVERFHSILREYLNSPDVTRVRLYLETIESVLKGKNKVVLGMESDSDVLKFLNISPGGEPAISPAARGSQSPHTMPTLQEGGR